MEDFSPVPDAFRAYEPLSLVKTGPNCGPVTGGTTVYITSKDIFESDQPYVRLRAGEKEVYCKGSYQQTEDGQGA